LNKQKDQTLITKKTDMKTLKTLTAALLIALTSSAFAADDIKKEKLQLNYTVQTFIDAVSHGKINDLSEVLDSDVKLTFTRANKIYNYNKAEILRSFKPLKNIEQNCNTDFSIIEVNPNQAIAKITMNYNGFSKVSLINMANSKTGWKITNISNSYL
jgi:hypothetical protein